MRLPGTAAGSEGSSAGDAGSAGEEAPPSTAVIPVGPKFRAGLSSVDAPAFTPGGVTRGVQFAGLEKRCACGMYDAGSRRGASISRCGDNKNVGARHTGSLRRRGGRRHHRRNCHGRNRRNSYRRDYYRRNDGFDGSQYGVHHADNRIHNRGYHCRDGFQPSRFQNLIHRRHNYIDGVVHGVSDRSCSPYSPRFLQCPVEPIDWPPARQKPPDQPCRQDVPQWVSRQARGR